MLKRWAMECVERFAPMMMQFGNCCEMEGFFLGRANRDKHTFDIPRWLCTASDYSTQSAAGRFPQRPLKTRNGLNGEFFLRFFLRQGIKDPKDIRDIKDTEGEGV